eukprot:c12757_g1_i1.p1 GENE.c12757_g1_i1~~c12757_g1_i1.p1  ORF type:complete len:258 (+),score=100.64 c12757_g1_i1:51-824(+)
MFGLFSSAPPVNVSRWTTETFKELENEFDETEKLYEAIIPTLKGIHQSQTTNAKKITEFSSSMSKHGAQEKHPLSKIFEKCAEAHNGLAQAQNQYLDNFKKTIIDPVVKFLDNDIKNVKNSRKNFRGDASKYYAKEQSITKLELAPEKADKLVQAKQELATLDQKCKSQAHELEEAYKLLAQNKRIQLTTIMRELGMMQLEHLDTSLRLLQAPHRDIECLSADVLAPPTAQPAKQNGTKTSIVSKQSSSFDNPFADD